MKKKLSMLLAASMITSMLPTGVFAASSNSLTNQPTAIKNSEWSVNYPDTLTSAPQLLLKATSNIDAGEQVTLTLTDAEWAFYDKNTTGSNNLRKVTPGANDVAEANLIIGATGGIRNNTGVPNAAGQSFGSGTRYSKNAGVGIEDTDVDNLGYIVNGANQASGFNKINPVDVQNIIKAAKGNVSESVAVKAKREEIKKVEKEITDLVTTISNSVQVNKDDNAQIKYTVVPTVKKGSYLTAYNKAVTDGNTFVTTPNATTGSVYAASRTALIRIDGNIDGGSSKVSSYKYEASTGLVKEVESSTPFDGTLATSIKTMDDKQYSLLVLQSELEALLSAANKVAGYVNFYDVNYETYNRISFRLSQALEPNDVIAIPVLAQVMGTAPKIDVTSARGNFATSSFQFATGVEGSTIASVNSKVTFQDKANLNVITISEASPGSFHKGNRRATKFTLSLPAGFSWSGDASNIIIESNNNTINGTAKISGDDSGILTVTINDNYEVSSSYNSNVMIKNAKISTNTSNAKYGDVKVKITGDYNVSQQNLVVATYATYGISLTTVTDVPSRIAGRNYLSDSETVKTAKVVFEEGVEDSWWSNRTTDFTVGIAGSDRTDLKIREVVIKVLDDVTTGGKGTDTGLTNSYLSSELGIKTFKNSETGVITNAAGVNSNKDGYVEDDTYPYMYITGEKGTDKRNIFSMNDFEVDSTVDNLTNGEDRNKSKFELTFFVEVPVTLDNADKELTVSLSGTAINEDYKQTVKVADIKEPLTFEYSTTDVNLDYLTVPLNPVTITENFAEGFIKPYGTKDPDAGTDYNRGLRAADLKVLPTKVAYAVGMIPDLLTDNGAPDNPTTGDVKFKDARVLRQSTESSKIVINPKVSLVRYIPEGKYAFTLANVDELGTDLELKDLVNVITAAGNKNTNYAQDVKIVVDGKTTEMIVDGKTVKMNAPAFIKDDRTMLPLRDVAVALGVADKDVIFNDGVATVASNGKIVQATSGSKELFTTGGTMIMDTEAYIDPATSRMYLPISFVAAAFGISSDWDTTTNTATLNASQKTGTRTDIK